MPPFKHQGLLPMASGLICSNFFLTLLFRLLSLAQEGQGWLKEGTAALASNKRRGFPPTT